MNLTKLPTNLIKTKFDDACDHLLNMTIPEILLPTQDNNLLKLNRLDTFRLIIFFYSMTGHPDRPLPDNWNSIPGASGCTSQICSYRDNYDELIKNNCIPIGVCTQSVKEIKEMTVRLKVPFDVLSDQNLNLTSKIKLPTFTVGNKTYIKRVTLLIERSVIKKFFYPVFPADKNIHKVLKWLESN